MDYRDIEILFFAVVGVVLYFKLFPVLVFFVMAYAGRSLLEHGADTDCLGLKCGDERRTIKKLGLLFTVTSLAGLLSFSLAATPFAALELASDGLTMHASTFKLIQGLGLASAVFGVASYLATLAVYRGLLALALRPGATQSRLQALTGDMAYKLSLAGALLAIAMIILVSLCRDAAVVDVYVFLTGDAKAPGDFIVLFLLLALAPLLLYELYMRRR